MRSCIVITPAANPADSRGLRVTASQHVEAYTGSRDATALLRWMTTEREQEQQQKQQQQHAAGKARGEPAATHWLGPLVSKRFSFDRVWDLDAETSAAVGLNQQQQHAQSLYTRALKASLAGAVEGRSICVITHGCTLSGRADLVCGCSPASDAASNADPASSSAGLVELALHDLYASVHSKSSSTALFQLVASIVSIQTGEKLRDLLYFDGTPLRLVTDAAQGGTTVAGGRRVRVRSPQQIEELVRIFRTGALTYPASHTVLTLQIEHLDLRMASDLSARGLQEHLHSAINRVSTVQIAHLAGAEFALASSPALSARHAAAGSTAASAVAANAARASSSSDPLLLAAQRWNRDPTVVKQAQLALLKKRRGLAAATAAPAALSASAVINVPRSEVEQKALAKSFDCLERVLLQLAAQPSLDDADAIEAADAAAPPTPTSFHSFDAASTSPHVSYRSSALTWLLTDTLRAHPSVHVVLLGFVSPAVAATKQTLHSLRFGGRVHEAWEKRRVREASRANQRENAAMALHAAAFSPMQSQDLGAVGPEEFEAELVWDVQQYLRKHALSSPAAAAASPILSAVAPSQPPTVRKEVQIHDAPTPSSQPLQQQSIFSTPVTQPPAAATKWLPTPSQHPLTPPLSAPARSTPSQSQQNNPSTASRAPVSTSPQTMTEALDAYLTHGSTPQLPPRSQVSFAPDSGSGSGSGSGSFQSRQATSAQPSPAFTAASVPVSLFSPRFEQVGSVSTTPRAAPSSQPRAAATDSTPLPLHQQEQPHSQRTSPRSALGQSQTRSKTPSPSQVCANPACCPLAAPATPAASGNDAGSFASPLPARLLDVLEVLRSGGPAPLTARIGSTTATAAETDQLAAEWPYHRDLVLHELTDQLAAWRAEQLQLQSSSPSSDRARMRQRVDELAAIFGDRIPVDALEGLMREEESLVRHSLGLASPEPVPHPVQKPQQQQQKLMEEEEIDVENAFHRGIGGANRRFISTPAAGAVPSKPTVASTQQKQATGPAKKQTRAPANTPARSKIPVRVQPPQPTQPQAPVVSIAPLPVTDSSSSAVLTADESWLAAQMGDVKSQMRVLTSQLQSLASKLPQHSALSGASEVAAPETEATMHPSHVSSPFSSASAPSSADALYASAAAVHSPSGQSAATLSYRDPQGNVAELQLRSTSMDNSAAAYSPTQLQSQPAISIVPSSVAGSRASSRRPSQVKVSSELSSALAHQARMQETLKQAEMLIASMQQQAAAAAAAASAQSTFA